MANGFLFGMSSYAQAVRHISKFKLWKYVLIPGLVSVLIAVAIVGLSWGLSDDLGNIIDNLWVWDWGKSVVQKIATVFGGLLILVFGIIIFKQLAIVISSPLMSFLSEKVENQLLGRNIETRFSIGKALADIARSGGLAVRNLIRELVITFFLLLLGLIPIFSPFSAVLIFIVQAYYAGFGNFDFALERHMRYRETISFVKRNRMLAIGNGTVYLALLLSFVGFLFALPLGTVAATIVMVERLQKKNN